MKALMVVAAVVSGIISIGVVGFTILVILYNATY